MFSPCFPGNMLLFKDSFEESSGIALKKLSGFVYNGFGEL